MRRLIIITIFCGAFSFLHAQCPLPDDRDAPVMKFRATTFSFDTITQGDYVTRWFYYKNTGVSPLIIESIQVPTGVRPVSFSRQPLAAGDSTSFYVVFESGTRKGAMDKVINITSNNRFGMVQLHLTGYIKERVVDPNAPIMIFDSTTYWFDSTYQGSTIDHEYHFVNKGKSPLIISNVCGSSGCIVPSYPKEPIAPGASGVIRVVFNTSGKMGPQDKTMTVTSNASEPAIVLHVRGIVIPPAPPPKDQFPLPAGK